MSTVQNRWQRVVAVMYFALPYFLGCSGSEESAQKEHETPQDKAQTAIAGESLFRGIEYDVIDRFSQSERQQIHFDVVEAEDRAYKDAEAQYPIDPIENPDLSGDVIRANVWPHHELVGKLSEDYRAEVLARYGVTDEEWSQISREGSVEEWPTPEL